jgi:predicted RNA-binding Zn-ribbon protein involved in translation (DUF1610 family)
MTWDPAADALLCAYCGASRPVESAGTEIEEHPLVAGVETQQGLGDNLRSVRCEQCGATVAMNENLVATHCAFCGSAAILAQTETRRLLRPESIVPLDLAMAQVRDRFLHWLRRLWFRPNALKKIDLQSAIGLYVPFWTYDCSVDSEWSADAGYYYYVEEGYTVFENGKHVRKTRRVRKTRWQPAWGRRADNYDDVLILASKGLPEHLAGRLGPFDAAGLVPFREEYLAGWQAEEYSIGLEAGWDRARAIIENEQRAKCGRDVPGDTHRFLRVHNQFRHVQWKHLLLPIWSLTYTFRGKSYVVLVNGQNGKIVGDAPYSIVKLATLCLAILGIIAAVALIAGG